MSRPPSPAALPRGGPAAAPRSSSRPPSRTGASAPPLTSPIHSRAPSPLDVRSSGVVSPSPAKPPSPGLLPSFGRGRYLPPPVQNPARESSDPRSHLSSAPHAHRTSLRVASGPPGGSARHAGRAPSPARAPGGYSAPMRSPSGSFAGPTMSTGAGAAPRAPSYGWQGPPAGHQHSQQHFHNPHALRHPAYAASQSAVRPPSPLHRSKSFHPSSSSASPAQHSWQHARPSGIVVPDSRPSLRRTHSKVSLASPTTASIPPSPAAPAFGSAANRHRTVRSNESGYRSLVRRTSFSAMDDVRMEVDDIEEQLVPDLPREGGQYSHHPRPGFGSHFPEQQHDYGFAPRGTDNSNHGASGTATVLPPSDPPIPPSIPRGDAANPLIPNKRTVFTPYEMTLLLALWNGGRYYPSTNEVDEVIRRTGLQRVQIRN